MFLLFRIWTTNSRLCVRNLHSNMFLLFLGRELRFLQSAIIYIPICFYYFKYADCDDDEIAIFTFQYVSIISASLRFNKLTVKKFTFQYVSIISASLRFNKLTVKKFTFQYVSIISGTAPQGEQTYVIFTFQYVSIISIASIR